MQRSIHTIELLESRTLLAGVTILAHGYQGSINGWVATVADNIAEVAGGQAGATQHIMRVGRDGNGQLAVLGYVREDGWQSPRDTDSAEIIVQLDWQPVSDGSFPTADIARVVADWMISADSDGVRLAELPIHLIGHSRGASLMTALAQDLGERGIWVDHQTNLDPHPIDGRENPLPDGIDFGDQPMVTFSNVAFADTYWRDDQNDQTYDGDPVDGSHNRNLNNAVEQQIFDNSHNEVPSYYDGTIDHDDTNSGNSPIYESWYGDDASKPSREQTGFLYSRLIRGTRPASGLWTHSSGTGERAPVEKIGEQWGNVADVRVMGGRTFASGQGITVRLLRNDRDGRGNLALFLDRDTNPYNDNHARTLRRTNIREADDVIGTRQRGATGGVEAGRYWVCARIVDSSGHVRYAYSKRIEITEAPASRAMHLPAMTSTSTWVKSPELSDVLDLLA